MIEIVFLDIDGTLLDDNKKVSDANKLMVDKYTKLGGLVVLTTGRSDFSTRRVASIINSAPYIICDNGALVYNYKTHEVINAVTLDFSIISYLFNWSIENKVAILFNGLEKRFYNKYAHHEEALYEVDYDNLDTLKDEYIFQIVVETFDYDKAIELKDLLYKIDNIDIANLSKPLILEDGSRASYYYFDIVATGINKGVGIKALLDYLDIPSNKAASIGDHVNDLDMFTHVGFKVAMNNAIIDLREASDYVTRNDNNNSGVAEALELIIRGTDE